MVVKIFADCGIFGDDATQVSKVFHCVEVGATDADVRRTVHFSLRQLVQQLSLLQADGEDKFLAASKKQFTMCCRASSMKARRVVVSKQQLGDEFLNGCHACKVTLKVEHTAIYSATDVDVIWQDLFCLTEHDAEEDGGQCGGPDTSFML